jgi:hypothetical protein
VIIKPAKTFCLPCEEISIHPDDDPANFHTYFVQRQENGKTLCCADDGRLRGFRGKDSNVKC